MFNISILIIGRLNYKYHRLVASSDRPGELPQVEKCVVDDDEEDEEEVRDVSLLSILWLRNLLVEFADYWEILDSFRTSSPSWLSEIFESFRVFVGNLRKTSGNVWWNTKVFGWSSALHLVKLYDIISRSWYEFYPRLCFFHGNWVYRVLPRRFISGSARTAEKKFSRRLRTWLVEERRR